MSICQGKSYKNPSSHTFNIYLYTQETNIKVNAQNRGFFYFHNMKATAVSSHLLQIQNVTFMYWKWNTFSILNMTVFSFSVTNK